MNLYQATELARLESHVDQETGEIDIAIFENSQIALKDKQIAVVAYLKNEVANIDMLNNAIKELQVRMKAMQSRHDGLKDYLLTNMLANGISEINALDFTFSAKIKNNPPSVVIDNESLIDGGFKRLADPLPLVVDKKLIKAAIEAGQVVEGAHLETKQRIEIK